MLVDHSISSALSVLNDRLGGQNGRWLVIGSTAIALHGLASAPRDIDLLMDLTAISHAAEALHDDIIMPAALRQSARIRSVWGRARIMGVTVDLLSSLEVLTDTHDWIGVPLAGLHTDVVGLNGRRIPIASLESLARVYTVLAQGALASAPRGLEIVTAALREPTGARRRSH